MDVPPIPLRQDSEQGPHLAWGEVTYPWRRDHLVDLHYFVIGYQFGGGLPVAVQETTQGIYGAAGGGRESIWGELGVDTFWFRGRRTRSRWGRLGFVSVG
jgi:hypothetical protein